MKRVAWIFILFLTFTSLFTFAPVAHAQTTQIGLFNISESAENVGTIIDQSVSNGQSNKETYSVNSMIIQMDSATCIIRGCSSNTQSAFYYGKSTIAAASNVMLAMYQNPPADLALWLHSTAQDLGFEPKTAYAQGIGFNGLSILLPIWQAFRNIAYALLAVVMVVIGFMVMFRQKIDPKTVVTVQNALPKIVLALLLITFSYAIAAFMIDLMYLIMAIVINLLVSSSNGALGTNGAATTTQYLSGNIGTLFNALFGGGLSAITDTFRFIFFTSTSGVSGTGIPWFTQAAQAAIAITAFPLEGTMLVLIALIVAIALLFGIVRIVFMLISAYIQILVSVLIAPFQLMTEALPGSTGFSSWMKNLVANLSVFPITAAMLLVGTILTKSNGNGGIAGIVGNASSTGTIWAPPLLGGGGVNGGIEGIIGLGILLTIPNVANSVKEALKAKAPVEAGLGAILGPIGGGVGQVMTLGYQASMIKSMIRPPHQDNTDLQTILKAIQKPGSEVTGDGH